MCLGLKDALTLLGAGAAFLAVDIVAGLLGFQIMVGPEIAFLPLRWIGVALCALAVIVGVGELLSPAGRPDSSERSDVADPAAANGPNAATASTHSGR